MSNSAQILATSVPPEDVTKIAEDALAWLVAEGVVQAQADDSGLGHPGHRPGKNAESVVLAQKKGVMDFRDLRTNGVEIHSEGWSVRTSNDEIPSFACPRCNAEIESDEVLPVLDALVNPAATPPEIACAKCKELSPLSTLAVENGVLSNLSFQFWNWWPLQPAFIERLEKQCGASLVVLHERF